MTAFLRAVHFHGCPFQAGSDMLFEQVPAYLHFVDFSTTTLDERPDRDPEHGYRRYRPQRLAPARPNLAITRQEPLLFQRAYWTRPRGLTVMRARVIEIGRCGPGAK